MFVCAFSLYQCEDGSGPTIAEQLGTEPDDSPFVRVLQNIRSRGDAVGWAWRWRSAIVALPGAFLFFAAFTFLMPVLVTGCIPCYSCCYFPRLNGSDVTEWASVPWSSTNWWRSDYVPVPLETGGLASGHRGILDCAFSVRQVVAAPGWVRLVSPLVASLLGL